MKEIERIKEQLRRSLEGEAWHGPSLLEVVDGIDAKAALAKPIANAHSIWEIVRHVTVDAREVLGRLRGVARDLTPEDDWPPVDPSADDKQWRTDIEQLKRVHSELFEEIERADDSKLDDPIVEGFSSTYITLHGLVQHNLYHAGQIAILRKGVKASS
ncbi:MAG: DinB family protein [Candidatus Zixiibacteriota bacterium]|nr:MAG: DinB family protein [candidate division Zixibacteria bacterium]